MMKTITKLLFFALAAATICGQALGQSATGVVNLQSINGTGPGQTFTYGIALKNTGTVNLGTFWYAWIPFSGTLPDNYYNFLVSDPSAETSPTGWTANVVGPSLIGYGYSIQWVAGSNPLTPGSTDDFGFTTADNFATVTGSHYGFPTGYSYIYTAGPEAGDPTALVNVQAGTSVVPEPATISLMAVGGAGLCIRRRRPIAVAAE